MSKAGAGAQIQGFEYLNPLASRAPSCSPQTQFCQWGLLGAMLGYVMDEYVFHCMSGEIFQGLATPYSYILPGTAGGWFCSSTVEALGGRLFQPLFGISYYLDCKCFGAGGVSSLGICTASSIVGLGPSSCYCNRNRWC